MLKPGSFDQVFFTQTGVSARFLEHKLVSSQIFLTNHDPSNSDMDYGIFNVHTDVNARDCARGCMSTVRESALKVDWEKNPLPHLQDKLVFKPDLFRISWCLSLISSG